MSKAISCSQKKDFLNAVLLIAAQLPIDTLQFGIEIYDSSIENNLTFQSYHDFVVTVNQLLYQVNLNCKPDGTLIFIQK